MGHFATDRLDPEVEARVQAAASLREEERRRVAQQTMADYLVDPHTPDTFTLRRLYHALESRGIAREYAVGAFWDLHAQGILVLDGSLVRVDRTRVPQHAQSDRLVVPARDPGLADEAEADLAPPGMVRACYWCGGSLGERLLLCLPRHRPGSVLAFCQACGEDQRTGSEHHWITT